MTKVKFVQSVAGISPSPCGKQYPTFAFREGFVGNLIDDKIALAWVASGICVLAEPDDKCRPPKPEFAVTVPVEVAVARRGPGRAKSSAKLAPAPVQEISEEKEEEQTS